MIRLTKEQVLSIYGILIKKTGGSSGVLNESSIDSALNNIWQTFDGLELYPTLAEKGARLGYSLVRNHSFSDGNKRIGILTMLTFLSVNGIEITWTDTEIVETGLALASGLMDYEALLAWLREHWAVKDTCGIENTSSGLQNKAESLDKR